MFKDIKLRVNVDLHDRRDIRSWGLMDEGCW